MSQDIKCSLYRSGTQIAQHLPFQKDNMNVQEAAYHGGQAPYFRCWLYTLAAGVSFQQGDLLQDEANNDPTTDSLAKYRIINDPESFPDGHWEIAADRMVGK